MEKSIITFSANEQNLQKTGGIGCYASDTVSYIEAQFALGENWSGYDSIRAVWFNDYKTISTVLDPNGVCIVPHEVLTNRGKVMVNLVGSVLVSDELSDRLTTFPCEALKVSAKAKISGSETAAVTPSQFEQFVEAVKDNADRAEAGAQAAAASALSASNSASDASNSADRVAQMVAEVIAEIEEFEGVTVTVETLPAGSQATSSFANGVLHLGIPKGDTGATGATGNGIESAILNADYTLTLTFTDGTSYTTPSIRGATGATGATGNGISSVTLTSTSGAVKTYTIAFTDGTNTTFDVTDGEVTQAVLDEEITALKSEISDVKTDVDNLSQPNGGYDENDNLADGLLLTQGYYANGGTFVNNANYSYLTVDVSQTAKVYIDGTLHIYTSTEFSSLGIFCDANGDFLESIIAITGASPSFPIEIEVPNNAKTLKLSTDYKASDYPSSLPNGLVCYPWEDDVNTKKLKLIAGVIRNSGNGWEYIDDARHEPLNLTSVSVDSNGKIEIDYGFTASKVLSLVATPDETFARKYSIGGSVGLDKTLFNVYSTPISYGGQVSVSNNSVNVTYSTFTSGSFSTSTGELKLFHPTLASLVAKEKFNVSATCKNVSYDVRLGSQGNDYVSLFIINSSGSVVKDTTDLTITLTAIRQVNSAFVDANDIVSAGGNFWIYGVMEI